MTKEQAIAILKQPDRIGCHLIKANDEESNKYNQESIEALNMAIKALEQQSENCVSRQAVLDKAELIELEDGQTFYCISPEDVKALPPVTPTQKVGKWLLPDKYYDIYIWRKCSVCNTHFEKYHKYVTFSGEITYTEEKADYCKVCGANMRGCE